LNSIFIFGKCLLAAKPTTRSEKVSKRETYKPKVSKTITTPEPKLAHANKNQTKICQNTGLKNNRTTIQNNTSMKQNPAEAI